MDTGDARDGVRRRYDLLVDDDPEERGMSLLRVVGSVAVAVGAGAAAAAWRKRNRETLALPAPGETTAEPAEEATPDDPDVDAARARLREDAEQLRRELADDPDPA